MTSFPPGDACFDMQGKVAFFIHDSRFFWVLMDGSSNKGWIHTYILPVKSHTSSNEAQLLMHCL
jgi:hypothetical protein